MSSVFANLVGWSRNPLVNRMSGGLDVLSLREDDVKKFLTCGTHLGATNLDFQMEQYVYKRKTDGMICELQLTTCQQSVCVNLPVWYIYQKNMICLKPLQRCVHWKDQNHEVLAAVDLPQTVIRDSYCLRMSRVWKGYIALHCRCKRKIGVVKWDGRRLVTDHHKVIINPWLQTGTLSSCSQLASGSAIVDIRNCIFARWRTGRSHVGGYIAAVFTLCTSRC